MEEVGYILLFHFDPPYHHARHCYDWATDINDRIHRHYQRLTRGPVLLHMALDAGAKLTLVRKWPGTKSQMLSLRKSGNALRHCKLCRQERRVKWQDENLEAVLEASLAAARSTNNGN